MTEPTSTQARHQVEPDKLKSAKVNHQHQCQSSSSIQGQSPTPRNPPECTQNQVLHAAFKALQSKTAKDLPKFNGESFFDWPLFISEYDRINQEVEIQPSEKLALIRNALKGKAREAVYPLLNNSANILTILNLLQMNFGCKEWVMSYG